MFRLKNLQGHISSDRFHGIYNSFNDCYMNSILQVIFNLGLFEKQINTNGKIASNFLNRKVINNDLKKNDYRIKNIAKEHFGSKQHDAHEFLIWLREKLEKELKEENPLRKEFEGKILMKFVCKCG
jgi:uncharacterized UBP type Zn finger protein